MNCRHCSAPLTHTFLDLGFAPPSNAYLQGSDLARPETYYPLKLKICGECWLAQTEDYAEAGELFKADYAYFSSTSRSWVEHARIYCRDMSLRFQLGAGSHVIEVASNDGYLLQHFQAAGVPCLGIEPTASTAAAAEARGIVVRREFFGESLGRRLAAEGLDADLVVGNNVYAHVPDINDFTRGLAAVLKPDGVVTLEFPHLLQMIRQSQFDTAYHEHFSYLSLGAVLRIFAVAGLRIWHVEELPTHGGSLRVYGCRSSASHVETPEVLGVLEDERASGLETLEAYAGFQARAETIKNDLLCFLIEQKRFGRRVAAYGAAAKGNTLLNYAGVKPDLLRCVADAATSKQGKFLPGSHIPIVAPVVLRDDPPDYLLILPWNLATELLAQLEDLRALGVRIIQAVPCLTELG